MKDLPNDYNNEKLEDESSGPASVPVPMPDSALPTSFDSDNPSHRYHFLDSSSRWLVRPVMETQGWDHDVDYDGVNVERLLVVKDRIPMSLASLRRIRRNVLFKWSWQVQLSMLKGKQLL